MARNASASVANCCDEGLYASTCVGCYRGGPWAAGSPIGRGRSMAESDGLHVVVGGSGATGRVIVRELAAKGKRVRAVNRSGRADVPEGVEVLGADATDPA